MISILYIDNHLLFLDKPAGLLTQPSGTERDSLETQAKAWIKQEYNKPGDVFLEAAHRIDSVACGVVLFARTSKALSRLNSAIREGKCTKEYRILAEGALPAVEGELKHWLRHDSHFAQITKPNATDSKLSTLKYKLLEKCSDGLNLVQVILESGRYHQIRAQFGAIGCPIAGDVKYGSSIHWKSGGIALQHYSLTIEHPVTHETLKICSKLRIAM